MHVAKRMTAALVLCCGVGGAWAGDWRAVAVSSEVAGVNPMTGLVVWADTEQAETDAVALEFSYLLYDEVVDERGDYDWSSVDALLERIAGRGHQAVLRFRFIYPGFTETAVPGFVKKLPDYREVVTKSEGKATAFCDWSHPALREFAMDFHTAFAERYDADARLAFVQTGFGLWAEYHIYDGPMEVGKTFPSKAYQAAFLRHLSEVYEQTPWSISIDAADEETTPFAGDRALLGLAFGLFDDSFLHAKHGGYNEACWDFFGRERWKASPAGGEFSYYTAHDQEQALAEDGPHGEAFSEAAGRFHLSYMFANDQPSYRSEEEIARAGMGLGYRFRVEAFETDGEWSRVTIANVGIAPLYHDAYPAVGGARSATTLRGLLPGDRRVFEIAADGASAALTVASDRLVKGQRIMFEAALMGDAEERKH